MSLAHVETLGRLSDGEVDEEEFFEMVSREELRTLVDSVAYMRSKWDEMQLGLARLDRNDIVQASRLSGIEGRMALVERAQGQSGVSMMPGAMSASESAGHEITERRTNMRIPIPRATELLDNEKVAKEMIARYQWWSSKARLLGVTARQAAWGFIRMAAKYAAAAAIGWVIAHYWLKK